MGGIFFRQHQNDVSSSTDCGICFIAGMAWYKADTGTKATDMDYGRYLAPTIDSNDKIAGIVEIK